MQGRRTCTRGTFSIRHSGLDKITVAFVHSPVLAHADIVSRGGSNGRQSLRVCNPRPAVAHVARPTRLIASMRKLIVILNAMLKNDQAWRENLPAAA